jgi:hypothetical protein
MAENGLDGADGFSPVGLTISPATVAIQLTSTGSVKSGQLPYQFVPKATKDGAAIALTSITITSSSGGTWSENDSYITLSALSGAEAGECVFTVVAGGQILTGNTVTFSTVRDAAAVTVATLANTPTVSNANSASFVQVGNSLATNARADGTLSVNLTGSIKPDIEGYQFTAKLQVSTNGGSSWSDVTGSQNDSSISVDLNGGEPGMPVKMSSCSVNSSGPYALTALGASTPCLLRVMLMKKSGANSLASLTGNLIMTADAT